MIAPSRRKPSERATRIFPNLRESDNPLGLRIGVLGKKWTLLILRHVATEPRSSFSAILRAHHLLSRRVLSVRLEELQREGYLEKILSNGDPHRPTYDLTDKGRDALPLLRTFSDLVKRYGEGVSVAQGREVRVEDVCFTHPDIPDVSHPMEVRGSSWNSLIPPAHPKVVMYKNFCEKCKVTLSPDGEAYVCSYECTWCRTCAEGFEWLCPNCQGHLQPRPRLASSHTDLRRLKLVDSR